MDITLTKAKEMYDLWLDCEVQLATGQAKSYRIGSREYTALDMETIQLMQKRWEGKVDVLSGRANGRAVRQVVPRDT